MSFKQDLKVTLKVLEDYDEKEVRVRLTTSDEGRKKLLDYGDFDIYMHLVTQEEVINAKIFEQFEQIYEFLLERKQKGRKKDRLYKINITTPQPNSISLYIRRVNSKKSMPINFLIDLVERLLDYLDCDLKVNDIEEQDYSENYKADSSYAPNIFNSEEADNDINHYTGQVEHRLKIDDDEEVEPDNFNQQEFSEQQSQHSVYDNDFVEEQDRYEHFNQDENEQESIVNIFADEEDKEKSLEDIFNDNQDDENNFAGFYEEERKEQQEQENIFDNQEEQLEFYDDNQKDSKIIFDQEKEEKNSFTYEKNQNEYSQYVENEDNNISNNFADSTSNWEDREEKNEEERLREKQNAISFEHEEDDEENFFGSFSKEEESEDFARSFEQENDINKAEELHANLSQSVIEEDMKNISSRLNVEMNEEALKRKTIHIPIENPDEVETGFTSAFGNEDDESDDAMFWNALQENK